MNPLRERRPLWIAVGLAAFLLVDVVLIVWAIQATRTHAVLDEPLPMQSFAPAPTAAPPSRPAVTETPTPTPTPEPPPLVLAALPRLIEPVDATSAWRTSTTSCAGGQAVIEHTDDGGATWVAFGLAPDVAGLVAIEAYAEAATVGATAALVGDCRAEYRMSFTSGEFWASYPDEQPDVPIVDPVDRGDLITPGERIDTPCAEIAHAAPLAEGVAVVCTDAGLRVSPDRVAWQDVTMTGAAVAVTDADGSYIAALRRVPECADGIAIVRVGTDATTAPLACLPAAPPETDPVAIGSALDGALWLWAGERVAVSTDGGVTWSGW